MTYEVDTRHADYLEIMHKADLNPIPQNTFYVEFNNILSILVAMGTVMYIYMFTSRYYRYT